MSSRGLMFGSLVVCSVLVAACGGETPAPEAPKPAVSAPPPPPASATAEKHEEPPPPPKKEEPPPPPPKKKFSEIIPGATFKFSLADSPDAKKLATDDCEKKAKKDDKKKEACLKDVEAAAAGEGSRYEKDDKGNWWWVSFAQEKGKEVIVNKVMFKVKTDAEEGGKAVLTPEGKDMGKKPMAKLPAEVTIEVVDAHTIAMTDPKKGRLVFKH